MEILLEANIKQALGRFIYRWRWCHPVPAETRYEHVGPQDTRPQDGKRSQVDDQRLDLADDLKKSQVHISIIMEYLVNISKRRAFWSLNEDILKITILKTNTPYPSRKIRRIRACTHQRPQRNKAQYAVSREDQYTVLEIWNEYNILEDIKRGPYSKKSPIRRESADLWIGRGTDLTAYTRLSLFRIIENPKMKPKKGLWSPDDDQKLRDYVMNYGHGCWTTVPINTGNKWSLISHHLPGRTDNEIKNHWHFYIKKKMPKLENLETQPKPECRNSTESSSYMNSITRNTSFDSSDVINHSSFGTDQPSPQAQVNKLPKI
ncbi:transcription factor LAF1-like protein [Tanacetum coccineum]